jgi:hypothetical protein
MGQSLKPHGKVQQVRTKIDTIFYMGTAQFGRAAFVTDYQISRNVFN